MGVDNTRENNRQGGTGGHDNGEDDGTELGNGVVDEKLDLWLTLNSLYLEFESFNVHEILTVCSTDIKETSIEV